MTWSAPKRARCLMLVMVLVLVCWYAGVHSSDGHHNGSANAVFVTMRDAKRVVAALVRLQAAAYRRSYHPSLHLRNKSTFLNLAIILENL